MAINGTPGADTLTGASGDDVINGLGGADKIDGGAGNDTIDGGDGNDIIKGGDGDDTITGGSGNDNIVGGAGRDTAVYSVSVASAANTTTPMAYWSGAVLNLGAGADGVDALNQVEVLRFNGQDFTVTGYNRGETYNVVANLGADRASATDDGALTSGNVLANDYDVDSQLTVTGARGFDKKPPAMPVDDPKAVNGSPGFKVSGQYGDLTLNSDGTYSYQASGRGTGVDHFQYSVTDGGVTRWVNLDITVNHVNHAPDTFNQSATGNEDSTISGQVLAKDKDGDSLTFALGSGPQHGSISFHSDGTYSYTPNADFNGTDGFSFTVSDGHGGSNSAHVDLYVKPVNDAPVIDEDIPVAQGGLDSGLPGVSWKVIGNYGPATGGGGLVSGGGIGLQDLLAATGGYLTLAQINAGGTFVSAVLVDVTFSVPPGNQYFDFAYEVDPSSGSHDKLFSVLPLFGFSVDDTKPGASGPYAQDRNFNGPWPAGSHAMFVLIDYAGDGGESSLVIKSVTLGSQQFFVGGATSPIEDTPFSGQFHAHDVDGDTLTFSLVDGHGPAHGSVTIQSDGHFVYTPDANYNGSDSFEYQVSDGHGGTDTATYSFTVAAVQDAPAASDGSASGDEDTAITGSVHATDVDGDSLTYSLSGSGPVHGSLTLNSDGTYSYTPDANYHGSDGFDFQVSDGHGGTDTGHVSIDVAPVNDAPVIDEDIPVATGGSLFPTIPGVSWTVTGDYGPATGGGGQVTGNSLTIEQVVAMTGGHLTAGQINAGGTFVGAALVDYTFGVSADQMLYFQYLFNPPSGSHDKLFIVLPSGFSFDLGTYPSPTAAGFSGFPAGSHFQFVLLDYAGDDGEAPLTLTSVYYTRSGSTERLQEFTIGGAASPTEDTPFSGQFHAHDVDGDALTFSLVDGHGPSHGSVTIQSDGHFVYTPDANYHGSDSFQYQVSDGHGGTDTATYSFEVASVNDVAVASNGSASGEEDSVITGQVHATDADGDSLTYSLVSGPAHGSLVFHSDGTYSYTPDANYHGSDSFTFKANDGTADSNTATVSIDVDPPVNDAPVLGDVTFSGSGAMIAEDTSLSGTLHATDADGDSLTFSLTDTGAPAHGSVSINSDGSFTYTPDANYNGTDSFTYQVSDGNGGVDTDTLTINVTPVNDAPQAHNGSFSGLENRVISGQVSASDVDGDSLTYGVSRPRPPAGAEAVNSGVQHGTLDFHSDGTFTYTPTHGFFGTDGFDFFVDDGHGGRNTAHVSFTVEEHNEAPVAADASASTNEDTTLSGSVSATDADGDKLGFTLASGPSHGSLSFHADGSYTYTPNANYHGSDGFDYSVSDGNGGTDTGHVSINVAPVNDAPGIKPPMMRSTDEDHAISGMAQAQDVDGDSLTFELTDKGPAGLTFNSDGSWTFDPGKAYQELDYGQASQVTFSYRAYDGHAYSSTVTQTLMVTGVNEVLSGGTAGKDTLTGTSIGDWIDGLGGDDTIKAMGGDDQVYGGGGADKLYGGDGRDYMHGDLGNDLINGEAGDDQLFGDGGSDTMDGGDGDDTISGGDGDDVVKGGAGNDTVYGDAGNDDVQGGVGDDFVYGGAGADRLSGGTGADHFVFADGDLGSTLATSDVITDFKAIQGDVIDFSGIDADTTTGGDQAFSLVGSFGHHAGEMTMAFNAGINATVISMDTNGDGVADYMLQITGNVSSTAGWLL